jgi:hypothetical protein
VALESNPSLVFPLALSQRRAMGMGMGTVLGLIAEVTVGSAALHGALKGLEDGVSPFAFVINKQSSIGRSMGGLSGMAGITQLVGACHNSGGDRTS